MHVYNENNFNAESGLTGLSQDVINVLGLLSTAAE